MPCYITRAKDGGRMILCGDLGEPCRDCGDVADLLCDYPVGDGKTCDASLCEQHAREVGPDLHYCAPHAAAWDAYREQHGVERELARVVPFRLLKPAAPAPAPALAAPVQAWGSARDHRRYIEPVSAKSRRRCYCGCGQRATHAHMANGVSLGRSCELEARRWMRAGVPTSITGEA